MTGQRLTHMITLMRTDKATEAQIRKAQAEGKLDTIKGAGKLLSKGSGIKGND